MNKLLHFRPYTFRNRLLVALLLCSVIAGLISTASSFLMTMANVSSELSRSEKEAAIYLLELEQKTNLPLDDMLDMAAREYLELVVPEDASRLLSESELEQLRAGAVLTLSDSFTSMPTTFLLVKDSVIAIRTSRDFNLFLSVFPRISFAIVISLVLFALLSVLASIKMAKPVSQLTQATRQVREGDFTVKLPENRSSEMGELMRSFNSMTDALARTSYLQKDFISSISHEFRTPIASIRGFARLLQMPGLDENSRQEYVELIAQESDRLSRLSDTLLRLSALEQQTAPASLSSFRLDEQIRQVILQLQPAWTAKNIDWQLELDPVTIMGDSELLIQVWINLIQNAIKFSHTGGQIEIRVYQTDQAVVEITDHGVGMSEETQKRIFDRFYQADTSRSKEGVGLGLCLVKRIMDILGGEIHVQAQLGQGSTFRARLPIEKSERRSVIHAEPPGSIPSVPAGIQ